MNKKYVKPRPTFPKKAVVTAGMPYGNKALHFGHIGGVFVHADTYARFLKDRIGEDNVIFVSGTDCYGSPIQASYKQYIDSNSGSESLEDYVYKFYETQKASLEAYDVNLSAYLTSAFDRSGEIHKEVSEKLFETLYSNGHLKKLSTSQFYDEKEDAYLNGRQVIGECPFEGCKSEKAYADECSLGHQYMPNELINPISILSGDKPVLKEVYNWYFDLNNYTEKMTVKNDANKKDRVTRKNIVNAIEEFLKKPMIYVTKKEFAKVEEAGLTFENCEIINEDKKPSVTLVFNELSDRDNGRELLENNGIRYRTGKTLVPFRLSGNSEWGVPVPPKEGLDNHTFWVWPESLWAPISFTQTYLESIGKDRDEWREYWLDNDSKVYQFIGEDNIYFYGIAEMALLMAYTECISDGITNFEEINFPHLVANCHLLFLDSKASSSGTVKPPMAAELLDYYTKDQLRMHFLSLGLSKKSVSFNPKAFDPSSKEGDKDVVLKDGNLLTNVFNRLVRSCFYTSQKYFDSLVPGNEVSQEILDISRKYILQYESTMANQEFHRVIYTLDSLIRELSKYWAREMKIADDADDNDKRAQVLADIIYGVKCTLTLLHPVTPTSSEFVKDYMNLNDSLWSWDTIFDPIQVNMDDVDKHKLKFIEARFDFFAKHESQFED